MLWRFTNLAKKSNMAFKWPLNNMRIVFIICCLSLLLTACTGQKPYLSDGAPDVHPHNKAEVVILSLTVYLANAIKFWIPAMVLYNVAPLLGTAQSFTAIRRLMAKPMICTL